MPRSGGKIGPDLVGPAPASRARTCGSGAPDGIGARSGKIGSSTVVISAGAAIAARPRPDNARNGRRIVRYDDRIVRYDDRSPRYDDRIVRYDDRIVRYDDRIVRYDDRSSRCENRIGRYDDRCLSYDGNRSGDAPRIPRWLAHRGTAAR